LQHKEADSSAKQISHPASLSPTECLPHACTPPAKAMSAILPHVSDAVNDPSETDRGSSAVSAS